jgi:hypothetical protein
MMQPRRCSRVRTRSTINSLLPSRGPEAPGDAEVLQQFELLPKMFAGVFAFVTLSMGRRVRTFGERDVALALCMLPKNGKVHARAVTAFGAYKRVDWTDDGPVTTPEVETGLIVKEMLHTKTKATRSVAACLDGILSKGRT